MAAVAGIFIKLSINIKIAIKIAIDINIVICYIIITFEQEVTFRTY